MSEIRIRYHHEPEGWWADSPDMPGFSVAGETLDEVKKMAREGVAFATNAEVVVVEESANTPDIR